jgi:hypothetical protein
MSNDQVEDEFKELLKLEKVLSGTVPPRPGITSPPQSKTGISEAELEALQAKADSTPMDFFRDLEWAYQNLGNDTPTGAPSTSALHLLNYGSSARSDFMKLISAYMMKKEKQKEDEDARRDDRRKQMKFINSLRDEMDRLSVDLLRQATDDQLMDACSARGLPFGR